MYKQSLQLSVSMTSYSLPCNVFFILVTEDEEYECASVLTDHKQDVKNVKWHPQLEVLSW